MEAIHSSQLRTRRKTRNQANKWLKAREWPHNISFKNALLYSEQVHFTQRSTLIWHIVLTILIPDCLTPLRMGPRNMKSPHEDKIKHWVHTLLGPPRKVSRVMFHGTCASAFSKVHPKWPRPMYGLWIFLHGSGNLFGGIYLFSNSWMSCLNLRFLVYKMGVEIHATDKVNARFRTLYR